MKIFCIGRNYVDHAKELNNKVPKKPLVFMKPTTALSYKKKVPYPTFSQSVHYELELVLHLSKGGKNIKLSKAHNHIGAIALGIDYTARDIQATCKANGHPWEIAKGFDNAATLSPMYAASEFNLKSTKFSLSLNGRLVQSGDTKDMIFKADYLIHYLSQYFTLEAGDLIYTGTPAGVGPIKKGDKLEGRLEERLILENVIV